MNLGNATLRSVSHSRPDIRNAPSGQSVTVSDDYHSLSDHLSDDSSLDDRATVVRWQTPPSQSRSPEPGHERLQPGSSLSPSSVERSHDITYGARDYEARKTPIDVGLADESTSKATPSDRPMESDISPPTPGSDDTPYIRYAIEQITRDSETDPGPSRLGAASAELTYPIPATIPPTGYGYVPEEKYKSPMSDIEKNPNLHPIPEIYIPVDPPKDSLQYHNLRYLPLMLRPLTLAFVLLLCLSMLAALVFCVLWSRAHNGMWTYDGPDGKRYFVFGYLPQILASLVILPIFSIQTAMIRVLPFTSMASRSAKSRSAALMWSLRPASFAYPQLQYLRGGNFVLSACFLVFWLSLLSIPLQSSLFQARLLNVQGSPQWRWVTVEPVAWALVVLYAILAFALILVVVYFFRRRTGLKWDPTTLADVFALLQRSNSLADYASSETFESKSEFNDRLAVRSDRLGYWKTRDNPVDVFYAVGEEGAPTRTYSVEHGKVRKRDRQQFEEEPTDFDAEAQQAVGSPSKETLRSNIHSPAVRYRFVPWFLRDTFVVAWLVMALVLLIAFLVVSFVNRAVQRGFHPLLTATPDDIGFSSPGFLYSFVPSMIGLGLFLCWQSIDMYFRALQPFANLSNPRGASAEDSLLLDYTSCLPVAVTVRAAINGHWKVAWISFVGLISLTFPILGGGLFWAIYFPGTKEVRMTARMPGFYTLVAFLAIYTLSFLVVWPRWKRYLPHDSKSLAEIISFVHQSPLLYDPPFRDPKSKTDLVTRLLGVWPGEMDKAKYAFGIYCGVDGKEHLGINRWRRPGSQTLVTTGRI
ncbi:MAG: hypothetical protein M1833_003137 [Piccolia ochrophora]|nr:MAG: hypothetical protein M1833_003137 [Piccolia ochrophora]